MNLVFLIFVASLLVGAAVTWRQLRALGQRRTHRGPVPGYSRTDGAQMNIDPGVDAVARERWRPVWLETFHSPDRSRLVVTLELRDLGRDEAERLADQLARDLQARSHAQVVLVQTDEESSVSLRHLFAPDGRGWSGSGTQRQITYPPA